jgi:hypothetical protein
MSHEPAENSMETIHQKLPENGQPGSLRSGEMVRLFAVLGDNGGAHESDNLHSVWSTREAAIAEARRLKKCDVGYGFGVKELILNAPSDVSLDYDEQA